MASNPHHTVSRACLAALLLAVAGSASAAEAWVALLDDDVGIEAVRIVADSEDACLAQIASQRGAVILAPCQPTASAITDPNDANKGNRHPARIQPSPASGSGPGGTGNGGSTGSGSSGSGAGGGGGGGW